MAKASGSSKSATKKKAPAKPKAAAKPKAKAKAKPKPKAKPLTKKAAKSATTKAATTKTKSKPAAKAASKKPAPKATPKTPAPKAAAAAPAESADAKKAGPKGITVVTPKPVRKAKPKVKLVIPVTEPLLKPGQKWKPLIPSGPKAPPVGSSLITDADGSKSKPARLPKRELEKYKNILLRKRAELIGDISNMEEEALRQGGGSLSTLPQHMAEQGSDAFEQSLSLDLAQVDRNLLREIDAALGRIDDGTYGVCALTGRPIAPERLEELPWARYSIEAARELERRPYLVQGSAAHSAPSSDSGGDD